MWRLALLTLSATLLSGCSYVYDLLAVVRNGELIFVVSEQSPSDPNCLHEIEVGSADRIAVDPEAGDDPIRTGYGTVWRDEVEREVGWGADCENQFPFAYGRNLKGNQRADFGLVEPKALDRNTVYEIRTVTGVTGYGFGRFLIHNDGRIENLPAT
ncbi:MAG: hypothetical protein ACOY7L_19330 [Pseudomonadota bacterium]